MYITFDQTIPAQKDLTIRADGLYSSAQLLLKKDLSEIFKARTLDSYPVQVIDENTVEPIFFIELRGKSDYSIRDSIALVDQIIDRAQVGIGLNDHGVGFGLYEFNQGMLAAGKKPINGVELYIKNDDRYDHLVLLAKNLEGYRSISKLISLASSRITPDQVDDPLVRPWNTLDDLKQLPNSQDLIILHGYFDSFVNRAVHKKDLESAKSYLKDLTTIFNKDDVYVEIQYHNDETEIDTNDSLFEIAQELGLKTVLTNDYHMVGKGDLPYLELAQAIGLKKIVGDGNWHLFGDNWHIHTSDEISKWGVDSKLTDTTIEIFNKVDTYSLEVKENFMPNFVIPDGFKDQEDYFRFLIQKGLISKIGAEKFNSSQYQDRLKIETDIISKMGFIGYFLIVADFINYAKRNYDAYDEQTATRWKSFLTKSGFDPLPIAIGPGRGSAAGSLIAYALSITEVDPLEYGLLFERFLNPERVSMPDIDTDIPDNKRAEIIAYVDDYYNGENSNPINSKVAGIVTFGKTKVKSGLKSAVRGLFGDAVFGAKLANAVDDDAASIEEILEFPEMNALIEEDPRTQKVLDYTKKLIGTTSNLSQHAAGYVITPDPVIDYLPVTYAYSNKTDHMEMLTGYTHVEDNGLLKMDFLGLKAMPVIDDTIRSVNKRENTNLDLATILQKAPFDLDVFKFIKQGNLGDIFQLASSGMQDVITRALEDVDDSPASIKKASDGTFFARVVAGIAMYRPGPMAYIDDFVHNALHPDEIEYAVPEMKDLLTGSFGLLIYQESIMALLQVIAGFTLGGADVARRTIGKKRVEDLPALKKTFIYGNDKDIPGGLKMGHDLSALEDLWGDIETFAAYGFNKSHAVGYAHIAIVMAYLAYYYPADYAASNLNHSKNTADLTNSISIYKQRGIKILPTSVSTANSDFTVEGDAVRFGLDGIRSVASKAPAIVKEKELNGPFSDLYDFLSRMARNQSDTPLNKSSIAGLIYAGALDDFYGSRKSKLDALEKIAGLFSLLKKENDVIFDHTKPDYLNTYLQLDDEEFEVGELLEKEHFYTGFYISGHPVEQFKKVAVELNNFHRISELVPDLNDVSTIGVITNVHKILTKKNELMAFITIEDTTGSTEGILFPSSYTDFGRFAVENDVVVINGSTQSDSRLIINSLSRAGEKIVKREVDHFQVRLSDDLRKAKGQLNSILEESNKNNIGNMVNLSYVVNDQEYFGTRQNPVLSISNDADTIDFIFNLLGKDAFSIVWTSESNTPDEQTNLGI